MGSIFGDYQTLFKLTANCHYEAKNEELDPVTRKPLDSSFMCCLGKTFLDIAELYPKTAENIRQRAIERRAIHMHYMIQAENSAEELNLEQIRRSSEQSIDDNHQNIVEESELDLNIAERVSPFTTAVESGSFPQISDLPQSFYDEPTFFKDEHYTQSHDDAEKDVEAICKSVMEVLEGMQNACSMIAAKKKYA